MQISRVLGAGVLALVAVVVAFAVFQGGSEPDQAESDQAESDQAVTDAARSEEAAESLEAEPEPVVVEAPENLGPRPELVGITGWMNTDLDNPETIFDDGVTVVQLWTFGCYNCKNTLPAMRQLYADNQERGLEIIGVHAPEFDYEADEANIAAALIDLDVTWPVALDPTKATFRKWQEGGRRAWPRVFVVDQNGDIRYDHIGEGRYQELRDTVDYLLDNPPT